MRRLRETRPGSRLRERLSWFVAQAESERLGVVTKDPAFAKYGVRVVW